MSKLDDCVPVEARVEVEGTPPAVPAHDACGGDGRQVLVAKPIEPEAAPHEEPGIATLAYKVAGPSGCGLLDRVSETIEATAGRAAGSSPLPAPGFEFVGWFFDAKCTDPVMEGVNGVTGHLTPRQAIVSGAKQPWTNTTYWGKFRSAQIYLRIEKSLSEVAPRDERYVYSVLDEAGAAAATVNVNVHAGQTLGAVLVHDLAPGAYVVVENGSNAWRAASVQAFAEAPLVADVTTVRF